MRRLVALSVVAVFAVACGGNGSTLNAPQMDQRMQAYLAKFGALDPVVACPTGQKVKTNSVFLCTVTGAQGVRYMKVTVLNSKGDIQFQASA